MNARIARPLAVAAVLLLPAGALAHEVSCEQTVGIVATDATGNVVLDANGNPTFVAGTSPILVIDHYPVVIGWKIRVNNLAADTSVLERFFDPFLGFFSNFFSGGRNVGLVGNPLAAGTSIPAGGSTETVVLQAVGSFDGFADGCKFLGTIGTGFIPAATLESTSPFSAPSCVNARESLALASTHNDIAGCRAKVICVASQTSGTSVPAPAP